jgi:hypothetical protein
MALGAGNRSASDARKTAARASIVRQFPALWRQGFDAAGEIDVAVIEIERAALPETTAYRAFTPEHLNGPLEQVEIGTSVLCRDPKVPT